MIRLAFIVSHPIQYYVPLYRRLAKRDDVQIKVFFTWHAAEAAQFDSGFKKAIAWDIPLTEGYEYEAVDNIARRPGSHHFFGLRNPTLIESVLAWRPDAVHVTGYAYASHLSALKSLAQRGIPVLFRGDSTLLDGRGPSWRWYIKRKLLSIVYTWPATMLYVGAANREYYRAFGVPESKLAYCPHSIEVDRFLEPDSELEAQAQAWRSELKISPDNFVLLFAGKFEDKKRPLPLMEAFLKSSDPTDVLVMVGDGEHGVAVQKLAALHPQRFRLLPFQNQRRMPVVYRLGDALVLPSGYNETWGLAVNEAIACGRPVLVSDRVGCHEDVVRSEGFGNVFLADDWNDFGRKLSRLKMSRDDSRREEIRKWSSNWSIEKTEAALLQAIKALI